MGLRRFAAPGEEYSSAIIEEKSSGILNAEKRLGRLMADLQYTDIQEVIDGGLHEFLDDLQSRLNLIGATIGTTFFNIKPQVESATAEQ